MMNATPLCLMLWNRQSEIMACNEKAVQLFRAEGKEIIEHFYQFSPLHQPDGRTSIELVHEKIGRHSLPDIQKLSGCTVIKKGEYSRRGDFRTASVPGGFCCGSYTRDLREIIGRKTFEVRMRLKALLDATPLCLNLWDKEFHNIMCNREEAPKLLDWTVSRNTSIILTCCLGTAAGWQSEL